MKKTTWSSSDYLHEDSPRRRQIPQAHSSRLRTGQSGGCWLQGVLRTPVVHARNDDYRSLFIAVGSMRLTVVSAYAAGHQMVQICPER